MEDFQKHSCYGLHADVVQLDWKQFVRQQTRDIVWPAAHNCEKRTIEVIERMYTGMLKQEVITYFIPWNHRKDCIKIVETLNFTLNYWPASRVIDEPPSKAHSCSLLIVKKVYA